jgi:hypothetical protein
MYFYLITSYKMESKMFFRAGKRFFGQTSSSRFSEPLAYIFRHYSDAGALASVIIRALARSSAE